MLRAAMRWLIELWIQKLCLLTDHQGVRERGDGEVFERCTRCRRRSPGWQERTDTRPVLKFEGDPDRHVLDPSVETVFGIPSGDPSPFFEDAGFEPVPMNGRRPFLFVARETDFGTTPDQTERLRLMRTKGVH